MGVQEMIIVAIVGVALVAGGYLIRFMQSKGIHAGNILTTANGVIGTLDTAFDTVKPLLPPGNVVTIVDKVFEYAQWAVKAAEQLYKTSQIQGEQRKDEATAFIVDALKAAGVDVISPELHTVIVGAVEAAVTLLPKTHDAVESLAM